MIDSKNVSYIWFASAETSPAPLSISAGAAQYGTWSSSPLLRGWECGECSVGNSELRRSVRRLPSVSRWPTEDPSGGPSAPTVRDGEAVGRRWDGGGKVMGQRCMGQQCRTVEHWNGFGTTAGQAQLRKKPCRLFRGSRHDELEQQMRMKPTQKRRGECKFVRIQA